jgi:hypothetical protein
MESFGRVMLGTIATLIAAACTSCQSPACTPGDPFVGFHAAPYVWLELKRAAGDGKYHGSFWSDGGPFTVDLTRDGNVARGTVNYGGSIRPIQAESTSRGAGAMASLADAPTRGDSSLRSRASRSPHRFTATAAHRIIRTAETSQLRWV